MTTGTLFGVGLGPDCGVAVSLHLHAVTLRLAVLREEDQRRGIRGLGREREVEEDERVGVPPTVADVADVEAPREVEADPHDDDERLHHEEARGAEEARDGLGELAELLGVVVDAEDSAGGTRSKALVRISRVRQLNTELGGDPEIALSKFL